MIASFKYWPHSSPIHRLDPRTKVILLLAFATTAASLRDLRLVGGLLIIAVVYYSLARLPWRETRTAWRFFLFFIVVIVGINTLIAGAGSVAANDRVLVRLPLGIQITWARVIEALTIMCRMLVSALMALPITFTIPPTRFGVAFRGLGLNDRIAFAVDLAMRLVPTYAANFRSTVDAQQARGFELQRLRGGLLGRLRRLAPLAVPVTMTALMSGEDMTDALDMRGFGLRPRTWLHARRLELRDWLLIGAAGLVVVLGIGWRITTGGTMWLPPLPF